MPNDARSNSTCFSWAACGAWSVAMASTVPSASATTIASVRRRAQRRIHLKVGVVFADVLVDQREVVRRDFARHSRPRPLATPHRLERVRRRKMRHVQP